MITLKKVTSRVFRMFSFDLICHLVFDSKWSSFEVDLEIIKTNILSKIHDNYFKTESSRMLTSFFFNLARWPSLDPKLLSFELDLQIIKTNILSKIHDDYLNKTS